MSTVRRIAIFTTAATYLLVVIGGLVRASESGLGCGDDWPRCAGRIVPHGDYHTFIEFSHRLTASIVVLATIALAVSAWRLAGDRRDVTIPATLTVPVVLSQAVLGAIVVRTNLDAAGVVLHLLVAMSLLALLIVVTVRTTTGPAPRALSAAPAPVTATGPRATGRAGADGFARPAAAVAGLVLVLLLVGSYVTGRKAGLAFTTWPWFNPLAHAFEQRLNGLHRVLAAVTGVAVGWLALRAGRTGQTPLVVRLSKATLHLFLLQIVVGGLNVFSNLHPAIATAHLALGAAIWAGAFCVAYVAGAGSSLNGSWQPSR